MKTEVRHADSHNKCSKCRPLAFMQAGSLRSYSLMVLYKSVYYYYYYYYYYYTTGQWFRR